MEPYGGNCCNFTSQCIHIGGIPEDKIGPYKWYYDGAHYSQRSPSWSSVVEFKKYFKNNVGSPSNFGLKAYNTTFRNVGMSDLIQIIDRNTEHNMFISSAVIPAHAKGDWHKKTNVNICQNSDRANRRMKDKLNPYPLNRCQFVAIAGAYK